MLRMLKTALSLMVAVALATPSVALACKGKKVTELTLAKSAELHKKDAAVFVDANNTMTREKLGVIRGAVLLTSSTDFDATKELPNAKDTKLVFYCANTHCSASHTAAKRALEAGFVNVAVLPDGIKGWKDAGLPTAKSAPVATSEVGT
jgi:rhodanese-related sulfurtransferase